MNVAAQSSVRLVTAVPGPRSLALQKQREENVPRGVSNVLPVYIRQGSGATLEDVDGNRFLDFVGGIACLNAGHTPPEVVAAVQDQAAHFLHTCFMVTPYEGYLQLAGMLNALTPGTFPKKTFFVNSGAEAVENAVKIARSYTRRQAVIAFDDAFHGRTQLALSLTGKSHPYKTGFGPFAPEVYRIPFAYCYRCPVDLTWPACGAKCADQLEMAFIRKVEANAVAAVIFEPILGEGGFVVPPPEWFRKIEQTCRNNGVLVIADEIQSGMFRTGSAYASERLGITPDIILTGKSIAGGLPLAAVTGRAEIMDTPEPGGLGGTFGGNPLACAAGIATLQRMERLQLNKRAEEIGRLFESITGNWRKRFPVIGDIRGLGAMRAIELVCDRDSKKPAAEETKRVLAACHQRGLLILSAGIFGNVIRFLAPLVATDAQIEEGMSILEEALGTVS
ncbi:MAG: 4-aminobutyrate--2-oxoglutarate transaminase [Terriglobia bacterium]|nr:MAG: 4-aminobutyrate--2-oxoglutarate transaminase [Terriglobia bacterium]